MNIIISNSSGKPIYQQIVAQIKQLIMTDVLKEGDALPSMRTLAKELRISVITTKRAYEELEKEGFIETITGKGSFVAGKDKELIREERYRQIEALLEKACETARMNGMTLEELLDIMTLLYKEE
ncbi:GntR family transcriptional regulator [Longicatena caecimuris]|uniref:GntR family transcriptional regulator n=1 Tax=Longicatena caecimuris TaxID=1796635 RepID=A0A4R3SU01_9FIRM|nr:GntR family transcriptional regulator [Longicatena caecimuris]MCR1871469.1 GntR family transcriptional regulator [Longicatena caecimuris]MCU0104001.1 GntR family transcriptional regulator [Longicatena caecimuris]TCU52258.1 GntR family transcriptional regulator [Longicatena caecimuris]